MTDEAVNLENAPQELSENFGEFTVGVEMMIQTLEADPRFRERFRSAMLPVLRRLRAAVDKAIGLLESHE